jgi:formyltetrahydrofolate hydrolase
MTYGCQCQDGKGLLAAILEFMADHQEWAVEYHTTDNNGFTIIKKFV